MTIAGTPSLRELRAKAKAVLSAITLPSNPTIVDSPVNPTDESDLPEVHIFDGTRSSTSNSAMKAYNGNVTLSVGIEVTLKLKAGYADALDELADAIVQALITSDIFLEDLRGVAGYNTRPDYTAAETPLAKSIITISIVTQEKFVSTSSGSPAPFVTAKSTNEVGGEDTPNIKATFNPEQPV